MILFTGRLGCILPEDYKLLFFAYGVKNICRLLEALKKLRDHVGIDSGVLIPVFSMFFNCTIKRRITVSLCVFFLK